MFKITCKIIVVFLFVLASALWAEIHCVTDISHDFSFYFDGRFGRNYVQPNGIDVRNWGTLHKYDFANANLLIIQSSASPCRYPPEDIKAVEKFLAEGAGVVVLGDYALFRDEKQYNLNALSSHFGAEFTKETAQKPLKGLSILENEKIDSYSPKIIKLADPSEWEVLVKDSEGRVVAAKKNVGKGTLVVASRSLCGRNPNASDPINDTWWKPLLQQITANKVVDPKHRPKDQMPENKTQQKRLPVQYSDYMKGYADSIYEVYDRCFPVLEEIMGVPPSEGMLSTLILLPTGGGGFSSGSSIGLAAWWGDFPNKQYGMVELISHESTHSWVHPFPEPMWNEGIATYVGILAGKKLGLNEDAEATLKGWIDGAKKHDPDMTKYDLAKGKDIPHVVAMAKPMWIFEQLRKEKPDIIARYFQTKRKLATPDKIKQYTADDSVAVLSIAMGRDLFGWFNSLGISVDKEKANIDMGFEKDIIQTKTGDLEITFIGHGTLMFTFDGKVIHVDPWTSLADYSDMPKADVILITHEHGDHLDTKAVELLTKQETKIVMPKVCADKIEDGIVMNNGETKTVADLKIEAVPAYNIMHKRSNGQPFHPKGTGNGYIVTFRDKRVYVAGDTENTPEMNNLKNIEVAFLPMNLPYTMTPEMVASAAKLFRPKILYPYHFGETNTSKLVELLKDIENIEVRIRNMK